MIELTKEERVRFAAIPRVYDNAGAELTRLAKELQDKGGNRMEFSVALERVMTERPDLADEHVNFDCYVKE